MKICLIGDSHVAMFVEELNRNPIDGLDVHVIAQPGYGPQDISMQGSVLTAETEELTEYLKKLGSPKVSDLNDFDLVTFVSQSISSYDVFPLLRSHLVSSWNEAESIIAKLQQGGDVPLEKQLLTEDALIAALVHKAQSRLTYRIAKQLREHSNVPFNIVSCPLLAETSLEKRPKMTGLRRILANNDGQNLTRCLRQTCGKAFDSIDDVQLIFQPPETIIAGCLTKEVFRQASRRLETRHHHLENDVIHAGPDLARKLIAQFY